MFRKFKVLAALEAFTVVFGGACGKGGMSTTQKPDGQAAPDQAPQLEDAMSTPDVVTGDVRCSLSSQLSFGYTGGLEGYSDGYAIQSGSQIWVIRNYVPGKDGGIPWCSPNLPTCGAAGVVSLSTIAQDLTDADVQFAFGLTTPHVYGVDNRPTDGTVWAINQASGGSILVGSPCPSPVMNSCQPIPPGIQRLADDLKTLATAASAAPECAGP